VMDGRVSSALPDSNTLCAGKHFGNRPASHWQIRNMVEFLETRSRQTALWPTVLGCCGAS
ncbi:hypothetical protein CEXT_197591, partial [Caerostris extrusa]